VPQAGARAPRTMSVKSLGIVALSRSYPAIISKKRDATVRKVRPSDFRNQAKENIIKGGASSASKQ
jgi:hypothetical protein